MTRLLAFAGYIYQSATAILLIFGISHLLTAAVYTEFSLALASSQLLCVLMFEWLQLAGLRFLAAARGDDAARLRCSLFAAGLLSAIALVSVGAAASFATPLAPGVVVLGLTVAVLQGITDMYFLVIRLSDRLGASATLMALRASTLLVGATSGAALYGTAEATLLGISLGHAAGLATGLIVHRSPLLKAPYRMMLADWTNFCRYGMLAAGASVIHLAVPVIFRTIVVSRLGATGTGAGFSIALDLLQRPFWVLNAAIHTVSYPEVVGCFEHGTDEEKKRSTARMFDFMICGTTLILGGLIGFLPEAGRIIVPVNSLDNFLAVAPAIAAFYFLHTHLQATLALIPHLQKSASRLMLVAACQLTLVSAFSSIAIVTGLSASGAVVCASIATAIVILFAARPTVRFGAIPRLSLTAETIIAAILIGSFCFVPSQPLIWLVGKIAFAALAVAAIAWRGDFLVTSQRQQ